MNVTSPQRRSILRSKEERSQAPISNGHAEEEEEDQEEDDEGDDDDDQWTGEAGSSYVGGFDESFEDVHSASFDAKGKRPANGSPRAKMHEVPPTPEERPVKRESRSWSDLDLSLVVALVSPIGNWLTGSDHVKNLFLLLLLIFYLHQLIEVPWQLYYAARPRRPSHRGYPTDPNMSETAKLALSELHVHELFYLSLAVVSPLIGASLIRWCLTALEGVDNLSWFSTALFVLATGIRPWSHLIARLRQRTIDLHDAIYYPSDETQAHFQIETDKKLQAITQRLEALEQSISEMQGSTARITSLQDVCDDLNEALGAVERTVSRTERKTEVARTNQDKRMTTLESSLGRLEEYQQQQRAARAMPLDVLVGCNQQYIVTWLSRLLHTPQHMLSLVYGYLPYVHPQRAAMRVCPASPSSESAHSPHLNGNGDHRLETIHEAGDSDSEGTYVSDKDAQASTSLSPARKKGLRSRSRSQSSGSAGGQGVLRPGGRGRGTPPSYRHVALDWAMDVVTWPYRSAVRILVAIAPPLQKLLL